MPGSSVAHRQSRCKSFDARSRRGREKRQPIDPRVCSLEKQVERLLEDQSRGVEVDRRVLKLSAQNRELKARQGALLQELSDSERRIEVVSGLSGTRRRPSPFKPYRPRGEATAVVVLNDWHAEERVDPAVVNGKNEFNLAIAQRRIRTVFENAVMMLDVARRLSKIRDLVVAVLGDMISGYIHEELEENNFLSPTEAMLFVQEHLTSGIDFLLKNTKVDHLTIPTCFGNHGRTGKRRRISTGYKNSYEWLLYNQVAMSYRKNRRVTWKIEKGYHNWLTVQGKRVRFHHGEAVRYQGGVGGVTIPLLKAIAQWDKVETADLDVLGHWHQPLRHRKFILGNCLIGYNPYSIEIKAEWSPPSQTFFVLDRARPSPVFCEELFCD